MTDFQDSWSSNNLNGSFVSGPGILTIMFTNYSLNVTLNDTAMVNVTNAPALQQNILVDFRKYYQYGFEIILYGYFMPIWAILSISMYVLMITVFVRYGMTTMTHVCLIAIAVCDSISPIAPVSTWFYFFAVKKHYYYLPFEWCQVYHLTTEVIPQLFTYTSYFITIMMTVQRYIFVVHPFKADKVCSKKIVCILLVVCFLLSVGIRLIHFFHYTYLSKTVPAMDDVNKTMEACAYGSPYWIAIPFYDYIGILFVVQTVVVGIVPCTILVTSELLMLKAINARSAKRQKMTSNTQTRNAKSEKRLTVATVVITAVTLFYMVPVVIIQIIDVLILMFDVKIGNYNNLRTAVVILNVVYWMCIPSNFIITCCLSHEFRAGIRRLFVKAETVHTSIASSVTLTTKNGNTNSSSPVLSTENENRATPI